MSSPSRRRTKGRGWPRRSAGLGVAAHAGEVDDHARLISDGPPIVARGDGHDVPGTELELGAVVHAHPLAPGYDIAEVGSLAAVGAGNRLHVLGPLPSRLERGPTDHSAAHLHDLDVAAPVFERSPFVGGVEALPL